MVVKGANKSFFKFRLFQFFLQFRTYWLLHFKKKLGKNNRFNDNQSLLNVFAEVFSKSYVYDMM
jgi:hypothetical protein